MCDAFPDGQIYLDMRATSRRRDPTGALFALLASLGSFVAASQATMTARAAAGVAVDWQVQVRPNSSGTTASDVRGALQKDPVNRAVLRVGYARTPPRLLRPGDQVEVEVDRLGVLRNTVVGNDHRTGGRTARCHA